MELVVGPIAAGGGCVARAGDGRVVFVRHSLPGELVRVAVTEETSKFARGDAVQILEASAERVAPQCYFARPGGCGGCDFQHASLSAQLSWKASLVTEHLRRIAGVTRDIEVITLSQDPHTRTRLHRHPHRARRHTLHHHRRRSPNCATH